MSGVGATLPYRLRQLRHGLRPSRATFAELDSAQPRPALPRYTTGAQHQLRPSLAKECADGVHCENPTIASSRSACRQRAAGGLDGARSPSLKRCMDGWIAQTICPDQATPELMERSARLGSLLPYRKAAEVMAEWRDSRMARRRRQNSAFPVRQPARAARASRLLALAALSRRMAARRMAAGRKRTDQILAFDLAGRSRHRDARRNRSARRWGAECALLFSIKINVARRRDVTGRSRMSTHRAIMRRRRGSARCALLRRAPRRRGAGTHHLIRLEQIRPPQC